MAAVCALQPIPTRGARSRGDLFSVALVNDTEHPVEHVNQTPNRASGASARAFTTSAGRLFAQFGALRSGLRDALQDGPEGLAPMHLRMLKHCLRHPGTSQQALVQASGRDKGQVARWIKEPDAQGLQLRESDPAVGRSQRLMLTLTLTPAGRAACQRFRRHESAIAQRLFEPMAAGEIQALIDQPAVLRDRLVGLQADESAASEASARCRAARAARPARKP